jgi:DNA modification methylase
MDGGIDYICRMTYNQEKLDVKFKTRSNPFNWRGQFTPEFIEYILTNFSKPGDLIFDPFSGSGTVLAEAARKDLQCYGYEINPAAYIMSKFFNFSTWSTRKRTGFVQSIESILNQELKSLNGQLVYRDNPDYRVAFQSLIGFGKKLQLKMSNESQRVFMANLLFLSEKDKQMKLRDSISKSFNYLKKALFDLPHSKEFIDAKLRDARTVHYHFIEAIDLIVTSPPYINVFNYHQNYRGITESLGFDLLKVAESEFGSNRKNRGNRFRTVVQYCLDMEQAIRSFWKALKPDGKIVIVVGRESNVRKTALQNGKIVKDIVELVGGFEVQDNLERSFMNKFGEEIKEDILVLRKKDSIQNKEIGREIAKIHLEQALRRISDDSIIIDLRDAIENVASVPHSPTFNLKNILNGDKHSA